MATAQQITLHEPAASALTPIDMLNTALASGADISVLEKLMALHERWEAAQARKAFDAAIAAAKAELGPVIKNREGHNNKRYADLAAIARSVDPVLSKHGLSYRFRTGQTDRIMVTCILSHRDGHSEETTLGGPADTSGSKNAIQAIGSTLTYLQRYSLTQALGLSASEDDDGRAAGSTSSGLISDEQADELRALIVEVAADLPKFLKFMKVERVEDIEVRYFAHARQALQSKRGKNAEVA